MQLILFQEESGIEPRLLFFALVNDADGMEDIAELQLYNDSEGLFWSLTPDKWVNFEESGLRWLGSRNITFPAGEKFPGGGFRAVLLDKGGERNEKIIGFSADAVTRHPFPKFSVANDNYKAESEYPENSLFLYNEAGTLRGTIKLNSKTGTVSSLNVPADTFSVELWAVDREYSVQAVTKRTSIKTASEEVPQATAH